jgi:hypothetical protein
MRFDVIMKATLNLLRILMMETMTGYTQCSTTKIDPKTRALRVAAATTLIRLPFRNEMAILSFGIVQMRTTTTKMNFHLAKSLPKFPERCPMAGTPSSSQTPQKYSLVNMTKIPTGNESIQDINVNI